MSIDLHAETKKMFDDLFLRPTVANPHMGFCYTCGTGKAKFINQLVDFENNRSCFLLGHEVESFGGMDLEAEQKWAKEIEYQEWEAGRIDL